MASTSRSGVELSMNHILELFKCGSLDCGKLSLGFTQNSCVKGYLICENCYLKNIGDNGRCLCGGPFSPMQNHPMRYLATHLEFNCQNNPLLCMASGTGLQAWDEHRRDCTWRPIPCNIGDCNDDFIPHDEFIQHMRMHHRLTDAARDENPFFGLNFITQFSCPYADSGPISCGGIIPLFENIFVTCGKVFQRRLYICVCVHGTQDVAVRFSAGISISGQNSQDNIGGQGDIRVMTMHQLLENHNNFNQMIQDTHNFYDCSTSSLDEAERNIHCTLTVKITE